MLDFRIDISGTHFSHYRTNSVVSMAKMFCLDSAASDMTDLVPTTVNTPAILGKEQGSKYWIPTMIKCP